MAASSKASCPRQTMEAECCYLSGLPIDGTVQSGYWLQLPVVAEMVVVVVIVVVVGVIMSAVSVISQLASRHSYRQSDIFLLLVSVF